MFNVNFTTLDGATETVPGGPYDEAWAGRLAHELRRCPEVKEVRMDAAEAMAANLEAGAITQPEKCFEVIDGFLVDPESGEIHGHVNCAAEFHVTSADAAEWVLEKMMTCDAAIAAVDAKQRAIFENLHAERLHQARRRAFFEARYGEELATYARANLRGKAKTWRCAYGSIAFRQTQPGISILDEAKAIAWVRSRNIKDAVKITEKLLLSECKEDLLKDPPPAGHGIAVVPAGEKVNIKSGVE